MMPYCAYKKCKRVATTLLGKVYTQEKDGYGNAWTDSPYVCDKHYERLLKVLNLWRKK